VSSLDPSNVAEILMPYSLVELIVLNVGLSAGIINARLFSMFVVEAVVLTFITTPITLWIYPERVRVRANADLLERKPTQDVEKSAMAGGLRFADGAGGREMVTKVLVVLQKIEHLAAVMLLTQMLEPESPKQILEGGSKRSSSKDSVEASTNGHEDLPVLSTEARPSQAQAVHIDALKLIELTGRTFSVMQSAEKDQLLLTDDALQLFRQFGRLRGIEVTPHISIVGQDSFPSAVADYAGGLETELTIIPWTIPVVGSSYASSIIEPSSSTTGDRDGIPASTSSALSPFESVFGSDTTGSPMFSESPTDVALFIDRGFGSSANFAPGGGQHIFLPFFGGMDDRLALRFVVQLCRRANVTATVVRIEKNDEDDNRSSSETGVGGKLAMSESMQVHQNALQSNQLTVGGASSVCPSLLCPRSMC
jgi:hypothetical protein